MNKKIEHDIIPFLYPWYNIENFQIWSSFKVHVFLWNPLTSLKFFIEQINFKSSYTWL